VIVRLAAPNFGTPSQPLLTQPSFTGAGIYEVLANTVAAAHPLVTGTPLLNLNQGGIITNDSSDRTWLPSPNGVITVGGGGGVIAASTTTFFRMQNAMSLGGNTLTVGSDRNIDGNLKHGEVRLAATVDALPGAQIAVIPDVALRLEAPNVLDDDIRLTLGADSLLLVDSAETVDRITGAPSSRILGAAPLTLANADGGDFTLDSRIEGGASFSLVKQGGGTLTLTHPASSFAGPVTVSGGRLTVNGSLTQTSSVLVDGPGARLGVNGSINPVATTFVANGTVSGTGSLGPVVTSAATTSARVAPGNSIGILTVNGTATTPGLDLSSGSGAVLSIEVGKAIAGNTLLGPGVDYDQIVVTGHTGTLNRIVLGFDATLEIAIPAGRFVDEGDMFFIAVNVANDEPVSGTFASLAEGATVLAADGTQFTVTYLADWEGSQAVSSRTGGNDVALIAVPEPSAGAFALAGAGSLLVRRRRRIATDVVIIEPKHRGHFGRRDDHFQRQ
jgi:autotransporter-associated beta strand protein